MTERFRFARPDYVVAAARAGRQGNEAGTGDGAEMVEARALALLDPIPIGPDKELDAELMVRSALNRHDCVLGACPDPAAHAEDMAAISLMLDALGLLPEPEAAPQPPPPPKPAPARGEPTRRQRELAERIEKFTALRLQGQTVREAAGRLRIHPKTAGNYDRNLRASGVLS